MKKIFVLIYFSIVISLFAQQDTTSDIKLKNDISFRLISCFNYLPISYQYFPESTFYSLDGSIMGGINYKNITFGTELNIEYMTFSTAFFPIQNFAGALFTLRATYNVYYKPIKRLELWWDVGGSWLASAFGDFSQPGFVKKNLPGISIETGIKVQMVKYLSISTPFKLNLFLEDELVYPHFYFGINLQVQPFFEWINFMFEVGIKYWRYQDVYFDFNSPIFVWKIGVGVDFNSKTTISKMKILKNKILEKRNLSEDDKIKKELWKLRYSKKGDSMNFDSIIFEPNKSTLLPKSYKVLNEIAIIILKRKGLYIEIGGYTNYTNHPKKEMELSYQRAKSVAYYLVKKGISFSRIKISAYGSGFYIKKNKGIEKSKRKVTITILDTFRFIDE